MSPNQLRRVAHMRQLAKQGRARAIRESTGISLREAAQALRLTPATLSKWETGQHRPSAAGALRWADLLSTLTGEPL